MVEHDIDSLLSLLRYSKPWVHTKLKIEGASLFLVRPESVEHTFKIRRVGFQRKDPVNIIGILTQLVKTPTQK